jgi:hypothetical protein
MACKSRPYKTLILLTLLLASTSGCASILNTFGLDTADIITGLYNLATALGALMIVINGVRWMASSQPEQRSECKKSIMYIMLGLMWASGANMLVNAMYNPITT